MNRFRLYIADMDEVFVARVRSAVAGCQDIEIVGNARNGRQALKEIVRLAPDVILTDIPLPELDGIALLRETQRLRRPPSVIVCTHFCSDASMQCASRYGASFFLCKPIEIQSLPALIVECGRSMLGRADAPKPEEQSQERNARASIVRTLLKELGISSRLNASAYLVEAAVHCYGDELLLRNLSHGLYAELANRMDTTVSRVERSLRSAISIAYERGTLGERFPRKPTNKQFIEFILREVDEAERERK